MSETTKHYISIETRTVVACVGLIIGLSSSACGLNRGDDNATGGSELYTWTAVDSLNATLPDGVRVYALTQLIPPLRAWYVRIDGDRPGVESRVALSDDPVDRRETATSFAEDLDACVVVNASYFTMTLTPDRTIGLLVTDETIRFPASNRVRRDSLSYPTARAALAFTDGGDIELAWAYSRGDTVFSLSRPTNNRPGIPAPPPVDGIPWDVRDAVGAGPMLLRDGKPHIAVDEEVFWGSSIPARHPRTAAGRTREGDLILMVVDGRQPSSRGVDLAELAAMMSSAGAHDALNLDGGGSSSLAINGTLVNRPAGGDIEREVVTAIVTFCGDDRQTTASP